MLRLATDNGQPVREDWRSIPDHALVTITLPAPRRGRALARLQQHDARVLAHGGRDERGQSRRDGGVEKQFDRAMGCFALTSSFARDVYHRAKESAERTNRRRSRRPGGDAR